MKTKTIILTACLVLYGAITFGQWPQVEYWEFNWPELRDEPLLRSTIVCQLPRDAGPQDIIDALNELRIEHSTFEDGVILASIEGSSKNWFIEKTWLYEFHFDENDALTKVLVRAGYTGP